MALYETPTIFHLQEARRAEELEHSSWHSRRSCWVFFTVCQSNVSPVADDVCGEQIYYFMVSDGIVSVTKNIQNGAKVAEKVQEQKTCSGENVADVLLYSLC